MSAVLTLSQPIETATRFRPIRRNTKSRLPDNREPHNQAIDFRRIRFQDSGRTDDNAKYNSGLIERKNGVATTDGQNALNLLELTLHPNRNSAAACK